MEPIEKTAVFCYNAYRRYFKSGIQTGDIVSL